VIADGELRGLRVLLVEDEALVSLLVEDHLGDLGCDIVGVSACLNEALIMARSLILDVGILDVKLNGQLSYSIADILRARSIPVVFATGYGERSLPKQWQECLYLPKPFGKQALADVLKIVSRNKFAFSSVIAGSLPRTMNA
jgi:DNA-binding NarL/FixJ family response regulator